MAANDTDTYLARRICNAKKEVVLERTYTVTVQVRRKSGPHPADFCDWLRKMVIKLLLPVLRSNVVEDWSIHVKEKQ